MARSLRVRALGAPAREETGWGLVSSAVVHLSVVAALGLWSFSNPRPRSAVMIDSTWTSAPQEVISDIPFFPVAEPVEATASGGSTAPVVGPALASAESRPEFRFLTPASEVLASHELLLTEAAPSLSTALGQGRGVGQGEGEGSGRGRLSGTGNFFRPEPDRRRFVFVVDSSKSMNHPWPGPARSRLGRVKVELWRTIFGMSTEQSFAIVFFNTVALPMPGNGLRAGGSEGQKDLWNWTISIRADGKTDPQAALLHALRMRPDVIYFLTDGEFNYRVVRRVNEVNTSGVTIHTISLGDRTAERFLSEMAADGGGEYRHIDADEDHYWSEEVAADAADLPVVVAP